MAIIHMPWQYTPKNVAYKMGTRNPLITKKEN